MAYVAETLTSWPTGIYQLEVTDPVKGGTTGVANQPSKDLAARTTLLATMAQQSLFLTCF